jgi:uncharacterized protein YkwD
MRQATCALAVLAALAFATSAAAAGPYDRYIAPESACPGAGVAAPASVVQEATMLCVIDYARSAAGLAKASGSPLLATSAGTKADDIVRCDEFSHTACGKAWDAPLTAAGYLAPGVASEGDEILGAGNGEGGSPRSIVRAWLEQAEHRAVLLGTRWREVGVAVRTPLLAFGQANGTIWVAHFGWRGSPAPAPPASGSSGSSGSGRPAGAATTSSGAVATKVTVLRLTALTARVRSGPWVRVRFVVTAASAGARRAVGGITVFFASRRARTDAKGRATFVLRLRRPGRYQAIVSTGSRRATATVLARR